MSEFFLSGSADAKYEEVRDDPSEETTHYKSIVQLAWDNNAQFINDLNFRSNAKNNLWGAVWHLFLLDVLRLGGYNLIPTGDGEPDIKVNLNGQYVWIEATSLTPGELENRVEAPEVGVYTPDWDKILLRLISGLEAKKRAFGTYIQNGVIGEGDICIVALNSVSVPDSGFWRNDMDSEIMTVLFGMGNLLTYLNFVTLEPISEGFDFRPTVHKASTNADINNYFFSNDNQTQNITGVIYSPLRPFYAEEAHLKWIHNPNTTRQIPHGELRIGVENWLDGRKLNTHTWWPLAE